MNRSETGQSGLAKWKRAQESVTENAVVNDILHSPMIFASENFYD